MGGFLGAMLTGVFANQILWQSGQGTTDPLGKLGAGGSDHLAQVGVQLLAATVATVFAFVGTLVIVVLIDKTWGFCLVERAESDGLDRSEHGEAGFDLGPSLELVPELAPHEPRAADVPPNGYRRFAVVVEGPSPADLAHTWSDLCQVSAKPPTQEFRTVYPYLTTMQGNRFNFRGGDPTAMRDNLQRLFETRLAGKPVKARVEG